MEMATQIGEIKVKVIVEVDVAAPVTELDIKLAAIALAAADNEPIDDWEDYRPQVKALIDLGWRPVAVEVTGKPQPKTPQVTYREPRIGSGSTLPPLTGVDAVKEQTQLHAW